MSYLTTKRRYRGRPTGMGSFLEDMFNATADAIWKADTAGGTKTETNACLAAANAETKQLDAKATDLKANWRPTGFYSPAQVRQLVAGVVDVLNRGIDAIDRVAADDTLGDSQPLGSFRTGCINRISASTAYTSAAAAATNRGDAVVNAPGLKDWVTNAMLHASSSMNAAYVVACLRPWWAGLFRAFATAFDALWRLAKAIVGVVVDVGTAVIKVAAGLPQFIPLLMWGGAALGAYVLYTEIRRR